MARVIGYHRPGSPAEALECLSAPGAPKVLLGGGTMVNADGSLDPIEVVDLQAAGLGGISKEGDRLRIGATVTLDELATDRRTPPVLASLALREAPSTLRAMGTVGGRVALGDGESALLAGLLAFDAIVAIVTETGSEERPLGEVLESGPGGGVITTVSVATRGEAAAEGTGRTPADRPIVAAVARRDEDGTLWLAMSGVAATPVVVDDVWLLDPPADFRGSAEYRTHLASVLAGRVVREVE